MFVRFNHWTSLVRTWGVIPWNSNPEFQNSFSPHRKFSRAAFWRQCSKQKHMAHTSALMLVAIFIWKFKKSNTAATADVVSRITGCVFVSLEESPTEASKNGRTNKVNIGLELKFSKRNQIVCLYLFYLCLYDTEVHIQ